MPGENHGTNGVSTTDRIEADIAATRERMGQTLEEIGARLNPTRLKREAGRKATVVARKSLVPIAITTVAGVVWLLWRRSRSRHQHVPPSLAAIRNRLTRRATR